MKPFIGITASFTGEDSKSRAALSQNYIREIARAGGIPVIIPFDIENENTGEYAARFDGILFSGGGDLSPHFYGEEPVQALQGFSLSRDNTELALAKRAWDLRIPVLGICRGCQVVNVALGGTLFQDIPSQLPQALGHNPQEISLHEPYHNVSISCGGSIMAGIFKKGSVRTNSFHHQSVKDLAPGLRLTAQTQDGVIEAFESEETARYVHCTQFHPEMMGEKHEEFRGIFTDFVRACQTAHLRRKCGANMQRGQSNF